MTEPSGEHLGNVVEGVHMATYRFLSGPPSRLGDYLSGYPCSQP